VFNDLASFVIIKFLFISYYLALNLSDNSDMMEFIKREYFYERGKSQLSSKIIIEFIFKIKLKDFKT